MIGEVRMFGGNFAPRAWALCDGQLLPINQNTALFSIIGTIYGGDGRTTFALPDIRGRAVLGPGNGPGLSDHREGQKGGTETTTLNVTQLASHNHTFTSPASNNPPIGGIGLYPSQIAVSPSLGTATAMRYANASNGSMHADAFVLGNTGNGQAYDNMQPWLAVNYIICMQGVFPSRS